MESDIPPEEGAGGFPTDDDSEPGLWKLHRLQASQPKVYQQVMNLLHRLRPTEQRLRAPMLQEQMMAAQMGRMPPSQKVVKLTLLVTGPVVVDNLQEQGMLWDQVAQVLLREERLEQPITVRVLPGKDAQEPTVILTIIAAGGEQDWEQARAMYRSDVASCVAENGLSLPGARHADLEAFGRCCFDEVDALVFVDRLHKYSVTEADKQLVERLSATFGPALWRKAVLCLTNDNYPFPPVGYTFGEFIGARITSLARLVRQHARVGHVHRPLGPLVGRLLGRRTRITMPAAVIDGTELYLNEEPEMLRLPDGSAGVVNLLRQVVHMAGRAPYTYQGGPTPIEELGLRYTQLGEVPEKPKPEPTAAAKAALAGALPGFTGGPRGLGAQSQYAQWQMDMDRDRKQWQMRKQTADQKGVLRSLWSRVAGADLLWVPYVVVLQVLGYQRIILPAIEWFRERDLRYARYEYDMQSRERTKMGLQPPRGLELDGVYIEEQWPDGEAYISHRQEEKARKYGEMEKARQAARERRKRQEEESSEEEEKAPASRRR